MIHFLGMCFAIGMAIWVFGDVKVDFTNVNKKQE